MMKRHILCSSSETRTIISFEETEAVAAEPDFWIFTRLFLPMVARLPGKKPRFSLLAHAATDSSLFLSEEVLNEHEHVHLKRDFNVDVIAEMTTAACCGHVFANEPITTLHR